MFFPFGTACPKTIRQRSGGVSASIDQLALTPGKGYGLAQAGVTRRPSPNATGVNGRPSWDFDVADDYLEYAGTMAQDVIGIPTRLGRPREVIDPELDIVGAAACVAWYEPQKRLSK